MSAVQPHESKLYAELSHVYDRTFARVFIRRIVSVIRGLAIPSGARVLEVGVGTGLSLEAYPPWCEVTGVDIAAEMLERARRRVEESGWCHVTLRQMDAMDLDFADDHFDYVTAFHVVTVVPDPQRLMREVHRVCRPGGHVVIINHFRSAGWFMGTLVALVDPLTRRLGWQTRLRLAELLNGVPLQVERVFKTSSRSLFTVVVARKAPVSPPEVTPPRRPGAATPA